MSRTYRKHAESFERVYEWLTQEINTGLARWHVPNKYLTDKELEESKKELEVYRYKYRTQTRKYYDYGLPREYRNMVNRSRRTKDRREIWKAIHWEDYPEQCDMWNCKSSNSWGYF